MIVARGAIGAMILFLGLVWFSNLEVRKLVRPDEGRYAEIPREMVASGDWVTPRLNDLKYFEKPALQYWATATAYTVFGEHQWTARLWPALTGFLGVLFTGFAAMRVFGREAGVLAGAVAASSLLYCMMAHINTLDMGVSFFLAAGLFAVVLAQREADASPAERNWMCVAWLLLGLAVLSKGLIGAALPFASLVVYTAWSRDWALWRRLHLFKGIAIFLAVTVPWFVWVSVRNPEFFHFFFIHEHFERFLTKVHSRYRPAWYFVPILLAGALPWTMLMAAAAWRALRAPEAAGFQPRKFLLVWIVFVFAFFSASSSKLPSYILPIFPALALLTGDYLARITPRVLAAHAAPYVVIGFALALAAPQVIRFADAEVPTELYQSYVPWLVAAAAALAVGAGLCVISAWRRHPLVGALALATGGVLSAQLVLTGHDSLAPASSAYFLARQIKPHVTPEIPFYSIGVYEQTLPFYIKRTVTLVEVRDEMDFGLRQEPDKFVPDYVEFSRRWRAAPAALAIMHPNTIAYFDRHALPYEIIGRDTRRLVVRKPGAGG